MLVVIYLCSGSMEVKYSSMICVPIWVHFCSLIKSAQFLDVWDCIFYRYKSFVVEISLFGISWDMRKNVCWLDSCGSDVTMDIFDDYNCIFYSYTIASYSVETGSCVMASHPLHLYSTLPCILCKCDGDKRARERREETMERNGEGQVREWKGVKRRGKRKEESEGKQQVGGLRGHKRDWDGKGRGGNKESER